MEDDEPQVRGAGTATVRYRPVVALRDDVVVGFEAVATAPVDQDLLQRCCAHAAAWQGGDPLVHSVPLVVPVAGPLGHATVAAVRSALAVTGLQPSTLWLVLAPATLRHAGQAVTAALHHTGVQLVVTAVSPSPAIDDFVGLPVDILQLPLEAWGDMASAPVRQAVADAASLARRLGATVLVTGVEEETHVGELTTLGCHLGQGRLWGEPVPAVEAAAWVSSTLLSPAGARSGPSSWSALRNSPHPGTLDIVHPNAGGQNRWHP